MERYCSFCENPATESTKWNEFLLCRCCKKRIEGIPEDEYVLKSEEPEKQSFKDYIVNKSIERIDVIDGTFIVYVPNDYNHVHVPKCFRQNENIFFRTGNYWLVTPVGTYALHWAWHVQKDNVLKIPVIQNIINHGLLYFKDGSSENVRLNDEKNNRTA